MRRIVFALLLALARFVRAAEPELRVELVRESLTGVHVRQREVLDGRAVLGGEREGARNVQSANAIDAVHVDISDGAVVPVRVNGTIRMARCTIVEERPLARVAYFHDVESGALLRYEPLYFTAKPARIFDPNPVVALNDPTLRDRNDAAAAVPSSAYTTVDVPGLPASGALAGANVAIVNLDPPSTPIPDAGGPLIFDRQEDGFEDVHAYFHIDRNQRYLQSLGYVGAKQIVPYAIPVDPHGANAADNSFFVPAAALGRGSLHFGDGGTDDAEDADLLIHEYGHAIHEWIAPGTFGGAYSSQARAMSEGFGDYWAFSAHYERRLASGRDPFCFADWDARCGEDDSSERCSYPPNSDCLRRLDSARTMTSYINTETSGTEHRNGEIWSSALREIHVAAVGRHGVVAGKRIVDTIVLESMFGTPPNPSFAGMARRMIDVDRLLFGGEQVASICAAMTRHLILADCSAVPRGELTFFQSPQQGLAIPELDAAGIVSSLTIADARAIDRLLVRVDIEHSARGDLRIILIAPDGREIELQAISLDRTPGVHGTFGLDIESEESLDVLRGMSAAGIWRLRVADQRPRDTGRLIAWGLVIRFAGAEPATSRPSPSGPRQIVPVIAHLPGANGTNFASELRLFNPGIVPVDATLIFTPSGADGRTQFSAVMVRVEPGQVVFFDDLVRSVFVSVGSGALEIDGDVIASSRTYTPAERGTFGQRIPATHIAGRHLYLSDLRVDPDHRSNLGITEAAGQHGIVRIRDGAGTVTELAIAPFSHLQIPMTANGLVEIEADTDVVAYGSIVDNRTGDPSFLLAESRPANDRVRFAPVIDKDGAAGTRWRSDVWLANADAIPSPSFDATANGAIAVIDSIPAGDVRRFDNVLPALFGTTGFAAMKVNLPAGVIGGSRTWTGGRSVVGADGSYGQFVPFLEPAAATQHLLHVESSAARRTNVGLIAGESASVTISLYDATGQLLETRDLSLAGDEIVQQPISREVENGRITAQVHRGTVAAYVSVIDNLSGDPLFVAAP